MSLLHPAPKFDALPLASVRLPSAQLRAQFGDPVLVRSVLSVHGPVQATELVPVARPASRYVDLFSEA